MALRDVELAGQHTRALTQMDLNTSSDSTNIEGKATLVSNPIKVKSGDIFSISIADVVKDGFLYNPINNSGSLTIP